MGLKRIQSIFQDTAIKARKITLARVAKMHCISTLGADETSGR